MAMDQQTLTATRRGQRVLALSVFNPDISSDEEEQQPPVTQPQQRRPQPHRPKFTLPSSSSSTSITASTTSNFNPPIINGGRPMSPNRFVDASPSTYMSTSSSRSSPAPDTTPSPSTPNSIAPFTLLGGDKGRSLDGLGLSVVDPLDGEYPNYNPNRQRSENSLYDMQSTPLVGRQTHSASNSVTQPVPALSEPRRNTIERVIITATADAENHIIVDITGGKDAAFIRERIFSKLHIPDEEQPYFSIYRTELGELAIGNALSDNDLLLYCLEHADAKGTLKFLAQRSAVLPSNPRPTPSIIPPTHSPPVPVPPTPPQFSSPYTRPTHPTTRSVGEGSMSSNGVGDDVQWGRNFLGFDTPYPEEYGARNRTRRQSPQRRRDPSLSSSEPRSLASPSSPVSSTISTAPLISGQDARKGSITPTPPLYMMNLNHRREKSEAAAVERERALEATERFQETQTKEYDAQMRRIKLERERQKERQRLGDRADLQPPNPAPKLNGGERTPPHGWILVNEVPLSPQVPNPPPRSSSTNAMRSPDVWNGGARQETWPRASPPADGYQSFLPGQQPPPSRPYPHSTGQPHSQIQGYPAPSQLPYTRNPNGANLNRSAHSPSPSTSKYPSPHPAGRSLPPGPPPGAIDPRMRQFDARNPIPPQSQFYPIPSGQNASTPQVNIQSPRPLQPRAPSQDVPRLNSPRSIPDLRNASRPAPSQLPVGGRRPPPSPQSLFPETAYGRNTPLPPGSPHRLPPPSPSRVLFTPSTYAQPSRSDYSFPSSQNPPRNGASGSATPMMNGGSYADASLARRVGRSQATSAGQNQAPGLRTKQSLDRLNPSILNNGGAPLSLPSGALAPPQQPTASANPRYAVQLSNSNRHQRPQSDGDLSEIRNRPSPVDSATPADALHRLEAGPKPQGGEKPLLMAPKAVMSPREPSPPMPFPEPLPLIIPSSPLLKNPDSWPTSLQPGSAGTPSTPIDPSREDIEGTLRPGFRDYYIGLMNKVDLDEDGTIGPPKAADPPAIPVQPLVPRSSTLKRGDAQRSILRRRAPSTSPQPELSSTTESLEGDEEYSDEDDDEDDDDDQFWQPAIKSTVGTPDERPVTAPMAPSLRPSRDSGVAQQRPQGLTVRIDEPADHPPSPMDRGSDATPSSAMPLDQLQGVADTQSGSGSYTPTSINRRASFRRDTWAFRPPAEALYDRLQDFFPDYDIDKAFIETTVVPDAVSPLAPEPTPAPSPATPSTAGRIKHRKSIRYVAEEGKKALERHKTVKALASSSAASIARKRSTKLWGARVEEVTPGQTKSALPSAVPESPTTTAPVKPIIKWIKGELIGKGTYGRVYLALNANAGEMMAVKQVEMPRTVSDQDDERQINIVNALKGERETLEQLDHPHVVQYLGFEQTDDFFSIFLEYVPGGSVGRCLLKHGKFDPEVIKSFTSQILEGLSYLHANKIIHRDVKADNILVDQQGICKISDFGISKRSDEIYNNAAMTAMQGSLFWMAPEMLHNDKKGYNAKIDIWSLGCVFIEMWAGRRPWEQDDFVAVMFKLGYSKMAPPVPEDVHLTEEADDFRSKCFTTNPELRPTAEELRCHPWLTLRPGWTFTGFR